MSDWKPLVRVFAAITAVCLGACSGPLPDSAGETAGGSVLGARTAALVEDYLERHFQTFPSRATAAGRYDFEDRLEDLDRAKLEAWLDFNRQTADRIRILAAESLEDGDRFDLELLLRQAERVVFGLEVLKRPARDPLFWTGLLGNATVFQLVRDDRPLEQRLEGATARVSQLPRLAAQAAAALGAATPQEHTSAWFSLASRQARASAGFYRSGFAGAAKDLPSGEIRDTFEARMIEAGSSAATALVELADELDVLGQRATGSPRLGEHYSRLFRLVTGDQRPVEDVLAAAEAALIAKRREAASYGRSIWTEFLGTAPPASDDAVLRGLFDRIAEDHADSVDGFIEDYRQLLDASILFVLEHEVVKLPQPLTVHVARSPDFFLGQGVGGVYPAGPYAPGADTLFYLPTPSGDASAEARDALFRDFNHHFNVMITPHEMVPGHYLQLKYAALHPRKIRALFGDGVFIEGWGTFCERLMLDLGWGDPLDRVAHLKKQLENIARTIVDVRVHTEGMTRQEVIAFVREEALQAEHFAANMWTRAITSSPQLTYYWLGFERLQRLYEAARAEDGDEFVLREFTDAVMAIGPIPVSRLRERLESDLDDVLDR